MIIVRKLTSILQEMTEDTDCLLASWQYNNMSKANVRLDTKLPNPTALLVQISDWTLDLNYNTKREAAEVSVFFLEKEPKLDNEALYQDITVDNCADIAIDFIQRVKADRTLKIIDDTIKVKSVFYQSDSNRSGVCIQFRLEQRQGECIE